MVDISFAFVNCPLCSSVSLRPPCLKAVKWRSNGVQSELTATRRWIEMEIKQEEDREFELR